AIEGDENFKYYHGVINKKRNQLSIRGILVEGTWIDSPSLVKKEIKKAVWDYGIDKSPGPVGFTFGFYRRYWKLIENNVVDAVTCFFHQGPFPKGANSSFIILIPKTPNGNMVKDYRPISLIGSMYKIISKILANHLVVVLGDLVNEIQSAFVADKQILNGPFILNELVQWYKKKKKQSLGFVIVNGSPTEEFQFYKGLKQGDPLSPFLFILVMKSLHISFQRVVEVGLFKGIEVAHSFNLSHMFYADDAIFMGQWSESNIDTIVKVFYCFNRASGFRINMTKSKLLCISVEDDKVKQAAVKIGCNTLKAPFSYLESKVGGCTDIATITRKERKTGQKRTREREEYTRARIYQAKSTKVNIGQPWVIKALHGYDGKIGQKVKSCYPSLWLDIIYEVEMFKYRGIDLVSLIHSKLGNGANTSFWEVAWRGESPFKSLFPRGGVKLQQFEHMKEKVEGCILADMMDRWFWALEGSTTSICAGTSDREPPFTKEPVAIPATNLISYLDSVKSPFSHIFFFQALINVIYPASVVDKAFMCCKLAFKLHAHPSIINPYTVICLPMTVIDLPMA
nr:RNA-directed DNA polymerase, eukaryota, reverse transcriptase zinc-binding domain protein [Tanacetum cinerariifolium]